MERNEYIYAIILSGVLAYMLHLYRQDTSTQRDSSLVAKNHLSAASAFWFYFAAYSFLLIFWLLVWQENRIESYGIHSGLVHTVFHVPRIMFSWLSNLSLLMTAIAYSSGEKLNIRRLIRLAGNATAIMLLWVVFWEIIGHQESLFWTSLLMAPDLVIANVALVFLGWSFIVRWRGSFSTLFFIVAIFYALLQLPAHLALELDAFLTPEHAPQKPLSLEIFKSLYFTYPLLAACHIMLSYGFISLICRSTASAINIDQPKYWLSGSRKVAPWTSPHFGGVLGARAVEIGYAAALAIIGGVCIELFVEIYGPLRPLLSRLPF